MSQEGAVRGGLNRMASMTPEERRAFAAKGRLAQAVTAVESRSSELTEDQKARIRAAVSSSRRAQGLPDHVGDESLLAQLAAEVLAPGGEPDATG